MTHHHTATSRETAQRLPVVIHLDIDETLLIRGEIASGSAEFLDWLLDNFEDVRWCTYWTQMMEQQQLVDELAELGFSPESLFSVGWNTWEQLRIETAVADHLNIYVDDTNPLSGITVAGKSRWYPGHANGPWIWLRPETLSSRSISSIDFDRVKEVLTLFTNR